MASNVKIGYTNISGAGMAYIREYDAESLTTRAMVSGKFIDLKWNGSAWMQVDEIKEVQETTPAPASKPAFITRKALVAACQSMDPNTVLFLR